MMMNFDIAIVGMGETGTRAALALRRLGFDGSLVLLGADAYEPYELPPLSKDYITSEGEPARKRIASLDDFETARIDARLATRVTTLDTAAKTIGLVDGSRFCYGKLLIATGASPRRLAIPGIAQDDIKTLRSADDAAQLRLAFRQGSAILIIGGGFIGLELAASASKNGAEVVLVEGLDRVLKRGVPEEIAAQVAKRHADAGVRIRTGVSIVSGTTRAGRHQLVLSDGSVVEADCIVAGIGAQPNIALAEQAGLAIENGIKVDAQFRTSDGSVFAAGDCASYPHPVYDGRRLRLESWRAAVEHAAHVARAMLGEEVHYDTVPWFWSDQYDLTLQVAGLIDTGTTTIRRAIGETAFMLCHLDAEGRIVAASGIGPGDAVARDVRLAEMLIQRRAKPDPVALADIGVGLKSLLKAS